MIKIDIIEKIPRGLIIKGRVLNNTFWKEKLVLATFGIFSEAQCNISEQQLKFGLDTHVPPDDNLEHDFTLAAFQ